MSDFLARSACRGRRPHYPVSTRHIERPALIARLLRERHVARFIVSPDGYGKTDLALQYADTVFSFQHVFWIDGSSPCFLRDLDDACITDTLAMVDPEPFLAVFEDIPPLDYDRAEQFSSEIDKILDLGCEVLVTCVPTCDAFERHCDRIRLSAFDLLLSDTEMEQLRSMGALPEERVALWPKEYRALGLVLLQEHSHTSFLVNALREELPVDVQLMLFVLLALQSGSLEDITSFCTCSIEQMRTLSRNYPYVGIDLQQELFETVLFESSDLAAAFAARLGALAARSSALKRDELVVGVADKLCDRYRHERACELVVLLATRNARRLWLARHGEELFEAACLWPASEVYHSLAGQLGDDEVCLERDEAARRAVLGDKTTACRKAHFVMENACAPLFMQAQAALILAACAKDSEAKKAEAFLDSCIPWKSVHTQNTERPEPWKVGVSIHKALRDSAERAAEIWLESYACGLQDQMSYFSASWILCAVACEKHDQHMTFQDTSMSVVRLAQLVRDKLMSCSDPIGLDEAIVGIAFERACERGMLPLPAFDARTTSMVRQAELSIFAQRTKCEQIEHERRAQQRTCTSLRYGALSYQSDIEHVPALSSSASIPMLTVNLFGGLDVRIGEELVDPARFCRQKVKTLLALLVLNRGREYARDRLVGMLWPESDLLSARKNFYGTWSILRHALMTKTGTCPYLIRQQQALRLDANLLVSDVMQLEEICRILLFERPGYGGWAHIFAQITDKFSDDLMPSEAKNNVIAGLRVDYRNRLVDALISAAIRLVRAGDVQEGLWFARAALQRDRTREDAYIALMRAQMAAGQRTAALDTFFSGRRILSEELGIDPSAEMMGLHRTIIESVEEDS